MEYLFQFKNADDISKWTVSSDASYRIGKSWGRFDLTPHNTGHFKGFLSMEYDRPDHMKANYTGYVNVTSKTRLMSFYRETNFDLTDFTHFVFKVRGDGRSYMIILRSPHKYTITWTYLYACPLYTHGNCATTTTPS